MDDVLLTKYVLNEANEMEAANVRKWIAAHPDNEKYYLQFRFVWEASQRLAPEHRVDEEAAWQRFLQRRERAGGALQRSRQGVSRRLGWLRIAAGLILVSIVAYYFLLSGERQLLGADYSATDGPSTDTLTDGSIITLDVQASLRFSNGPFQRQRQVKLHGGNVFFRVAPDGDRPFVIQSGEVTVTVLGTAFHVRRSGDETTVAVESGKVKVDGLGRVVELTARQQVTINTLTRQFEQDVNSGLILDHTPLWRIAELLEEIHGVTIVIARDQLRDLPMTTTLRDGTLDERLNIIAETLGVTVAQQGDTIVFK
ncbi:FecR domain-containing protein [Parapedobacter sp. ISTM3]|uniref:FecR family protein n=1 Tax=Parapedobacter sp. ISTM3 TaxID=2800130 RepID=UPI0019032F62|nr:FecR domain-containing protein [Parapedobacter sp. ISTM3]MBK1441317.1 FecR domain-containing protein [Parapedobacter sp. ISTM3]